jgi:glycosyltransferase involved in cell wall biosynthesis
VASIIAQYDCIVLPSYREGLSRVLLEAASMAKPIVTTNVPGCKDVVEDGFTGFLCQPGNSRDLAEKMEQVLCSSHENRIKMGKRAREKVTMQFDEKIVISKYMNVMDRVL